MKFFPGDETRMNKGIGKHYGIFLFFLKNLKNSGAADEKKKYFMRMSIQKIVREAIHFLYKGSFLKGCCI